MPGPLDIIDLGLCPYAEAWELQKRVFRQRLEHTCPDTLLLVEHPHVYTLGKNADAAHLIASQEYLKSKGIEIFKVDRGGDITYHGPGQLVGYPIFSLKDHKESVGWYVHTVEEVLIHSLAQFGIAAQRVPQLTGVWVGDRKIAAIGMRVSRWVTMHGFALNVVTDLNLYNGIIPCGIVSKGVTRMADFVPQVTMAAVKEAIVAGFRQAFGFDTIRYRNDRMGEMP